MHKVDLASATSLSRIGPRGVYGQAFLNLVETHTDLLVMSADLGNSSGLDRLKRQYPDRFINVGIAEQNLIGVAAGLAKEGFNVFASSFAPFISMRAGEQIRMNLGYMGLNVKAVGLGSGVSMGFLGNSHYGLEDVSIMRAIPGMTIISPADCSEVVKAVEALANFQGPAYLRLTGVPNMPIVYKNDYSFEIGKSVKLRHGEDIAIFSTGSMVYESLIAAEILSQHGIEASVINFHTLKPLDSEPIIDALEKVRLIVTVEEHSVIGGLGSAIAEFSSVFASRPRQLTLGLPDEFGVTGDYDYLKEKYGLIGEGIAQKIRVSVGKDSHPSSL
jgi:transketolase